MVLGLTLVLLILRVGVPLDVPTEPYLNFYGRINWFVFYLFFFIGSVQISLVLHLLISLASNNRNLSPVHFTGGVFIMWLGFISLMFQRSLYVATSSTSFNNYFEGDADFTIRALSIMTLGYVLLIFFSGLE